LKDEKGLETKVDNLEFFSSFNSKVLKEAKQFFLETITINIAREVEEKIGSQNLII